MKKFEIFQLKPRKLNRIKGGIQNGPRTYTKGDDTHEGRHDKDSVRDHNHTDPVKLG